MPKANSAFMKPLNVSAELAAVVGKGPMPRSEVVKKLWMYIKGDEYEDEHGKKGSSLRKGPSLQDPNKKRNINADAALKVVFGGKATVDMFEMTKLVSSTFHKLKIKGMKNSRVKRAVFAAAILLVAGLSLKLAGKAAAAPDQATGNGKNNGYEPHAAVCLAGEKDLARCHVRVIVDSKGTPQTAVTPAGYGPAQFRGAYNLSGVAAYNQTIAIVDAYDHPNVLSDLNTYSAIFGLPGLVSCPVAGGTTARLVFQKVNQNGGATYPTVNAGWALEISLDVEAAHAVCENCNILLVEANSNSFADLIAAVDRARLMGANVISNSYGANEFSGETAYDSHFNYPGIAFTFSSGDSGYGTEYPASSPYVTAVGGTTLNLAGNSYVSESAWSGAGSGCSFYEVQPAFQSSLGLIGCANRMVADVAADANPNTGAAVYDSVRYQGKKGWFKVGGTSLASPLVAGVYALAGGVSAGVQGNSLPYSLLNYGSTLRDVTSGSNGACSAPYLCNSVSGYDGPTGLGTPLGWTAF